MIILFTEILLFPRNGRVRVQPSEYLEKQSEAFRRVKADWGVVYVNNNHAHPKYIVNKIWLEINITTREWVSVKIVNRKRLPTENLIRMFVFYWGCVGTKYKSHVTEYGSKNRTRTLNGYSCLFLQIFQATTNQSKNHYLGICVILTSGHVLKLNIDCFTGSNVILYK